MCHKLVTTQGVFLSVSLARPQSSLICQLMNCATCPYITNGLTSYTFYATGETRSITSHITCNTKNVIYMVQCNRCNLQYIGETKRRLKDRFNEHRRAVDKTNNRDLKHRQLNGRRRRRFPTEADWAKGFVFCEENEV